MTEHRFGNTAWTSLKLDAIKRYLRFYTTALKNQGFRLHYIDGFAGTGQVVVRDGTREKIVDGSAKIALETKPPFHHLHLIDASPEHAHALNELCRQYSVNATVYNEDANTIIERLMHTIPWNRGKGERAVLFLDPYGLNVEWDTLRAIAESKAVDLWFLFSLSGLYRNTPRNYAAMDEHKRNAITRCLGTAEWENAFYAASPQQELFGDPTITRTAEWDDLLRFVKEKRLESLFPKVADPLILPLEGAPQFALFFAVSNPSPKAIGLSMKVAGHILKQQGQRDTPHRSNH